MHARINISIFSCAFAFYSLIDSYMHTCTHAHMHIVHCFSVTTQRSPGPCAPPHSTKNATAALGRLVLAVLQRRCFGTTLVIALPLFCSVGFVLPKIFIGQSISLFHFFVLTHFTVSHVHISSSVQSQQNHLADTQTHVAVLCPQLRVLKVVNNHALTDQGLLALAKGCPLLFELNLTGLYVHSVCMMMVLLVVHLPVNMNIPDWTMLGVLCLHACSLLWLFSVSIP